MRGEMIDWSRYPSFDIQDDEKPRSLLRGDYGGDQYEIDGPVNRPGVRGYMLRVNGTHVETHERQRDAKGRAERFAAARTRGQR